MKKRFCKSLSVLLSVILLLSLFTALPFSAYAAVDETEEVGASNPYNYYAKDSSGNWANCTWWAWQLAYDNTGVALPGWGNAGTWYNSAKNAGYWCDTTPMANSIVVKNTGYYGHVQFVTDVSGNQIYVKEGGYPGTTNGYHEGWTSTNGVIGYIHLVKKTPPSNAWITASSNKIGVGESIYFNYGADDAKYQYTIGIDRNGSRYITEDNWSGKSYTFNEEGEYSAFITAWNDAGYCNSGRVYFSVIPKGRVMSQSEGAGQTIPDGDYWICSKINQNYFMDISGDNFNTTSGTNLNTWIWNNAAVPGKWDAFHFKYLNNGYYRITQINTKMAIDVDGASLYRGTNVQMWAENNSNAQQWSIEKTDKGYKLRSRANNYYLDVYGAYYENNTNVHVWTSNESDAQFFGLIPYAPDERPIKDGIYTIKSQVGDTCYMDVAGEPGEYKLDSNIQIYNWNESEEKYKFEYAGDGYYRIYEVSSGLAVEIINAGESYLNKNRNAKLYEKNSSRGQFWKIKENSDGTYFFINELSGYYLDVSDGLSANGTNIHIHPYNGSNAQRWKPLRVLSEDMVTVNDVVTNSDATSVNPSVTVKVDGSAINSRFYSVKTNADISNGTGTVTITGKDRFCGSVTKTFNIIINDTTVVNDFFGNKYETEKGEIITYYANLTSPIQVNHLNGVIYYNQEVLEPIITNDMSYFTPNFENGHVQPMGAGQLRFDVYSNKPVSLDNTMIIKMQFRVIKKGGETWLGHQFETPEFTYENRDNYGLETHILTKQKLYDPNVIKIGDVNNDGNVDILDAALAQKHSVGKANITEEQLAFADVNNDGVVDILDAAEIQKFAAGIITEFKKKG